MNAMFGHVTAKRNQDGTRGRQRIEKITEKQLHSVARRYQVRYQRQYEPAYTPEPERREQLATTAAAESRPVSAGARCRPFAGSTARPVRDAQPDAHATRSPPRHSPPRLCGCSQGSAPPTSRRPSSARGEAAEHEMEEDVWFPLPALALPAAAAVGATATITGLQGLRTAFDRCEATADWGDAELRRSSGWARLAVGETVI